MLTGLQVPEPKPCYIRWQIKMSYINEALKKAQRDKDAGRTNYIRSIGKPGSMEHSFDKRAVYLFFIIILLVILLIYLKFGYQSEQGADISGEKTGNIQMAADDKSHNALPIIDKQHQPVQDEVKKDDKEKEIIKHRETLYTQATSFFKDGKLVEAESLFKAILAQDPGHIPSLNDMGVLSLHEGRYEDAIDFFEKAVKLKPKFANPYYNLACAYSLQNEGDKGMAYLLKAIEVDEKAKDWAKDDPDLQNLKEYAEFTLITN